MEAMTPIQNIIVDSGSKHLRIERPESFEDTKIGSSIACNGICLTVLELDRTSFTVQIMNETVVKSSAGKWRNGDILNLERALKVGDRLDGHWVMGHIDRAVRFIRVEQRGYTSYYHFELHPADRQMVIPQGSIAVNGISLTIAQLGQRDFSIALIEHSRKNSNLPLLKPGDLVNLEYDALGKYILRKKI
ncbi:MAG: riboflavin synthase [Candidatus Cloacimonetes bacterium]|nr:riboflavin synthase [Candidatus Cloacimonadota bacterium]